MHYFRGYVFQLNQDIPEHGLTAGQQGWVMLSKGEDSADVFIGGKEYTIKTQYLQGRILDDLSELASSY